MPGDTSSTQPTRLSGKDFSITWSLLYGRSGETRFRYALSMVNNGDQPLRGRDWELNFNFNYGIIPESVSPPMQVQRVNGDLYRATPGPDFLILRPGETLTFYFNSRSLAMKDSEAPSGYYVVIEGHATPVGQAMIDPPIQPNQTLRGERDRLQVPTSTSRYRENEMLSLLPIDALSPLLPTPVKADRGKGTWRLDATTVISFHPEVLSEAKYLFMALREQLGIELKMTSRTPPIGNAIVLKLKNASMGIMKNPNPEAYRLNIDARAGVEITASDPAGLFYGIQSLLALLPRESLGGESGSARLGSLIIEDAPRFEYRGLMLDVARNFQPATAVMKLLDLMSAYKLNKFHFHLTDDEGWRLEINALPELTGVGGRRGHTTDESDMLQPALGSGPDPSTSMGFYTRKTFVDLLKYAHARHIEVIPEIDLPGHARAAIKSMEARYRRLMAEGKPAEAVRYRLVDPDDRSEYRSIQGFQDNVINVCQASTYAFIETVVDEIRAMYTEAGAPLRMIHIGGDEVPGGAWSNSPVCDNLIAGDERISGVPNLQGYFRQRVLELLRKKGLLTGGWQEMALAITPEDSGERLLPEARFANDLVPYFWNNVWGWGNEDLGYRLANAGFKVVLSNATNLYFDLAYDKDPREPGLGWAGYVDTRNVFEMAPLDIFKSARLDRMGNPVDVLRYQNSIRLNSASQKNILGMQGQLWAERLTDPEKLEYMAFPKLLALAERSWAQPSSWEDENDPEQREQQLRSEWNRFANLLGQRELPRLDMLQGGLDYRLPLPGGIISDGMLQANVAFPGLTLRFTSDGSEPNQTSPRYSEMVRVNGPVKMKTFDTRGRSSRVAIIEE